MRKVLLTLLTLGALGSIVTFGVFSAFSSTTTNPGNSFAAGTVYIADNDAGAALYSLTNQKPSVTTSSCIKVTYTGSLDSSVKLYETGAIGAVGPYVNLTITPGTQASPSFPSCTGFVADAGGPLYSGTLSNFASTYTSFANGLADNPGTSATKWITGDAVVYKVDVSLADNNAANAGNAAGLTSGAHSFVWEAQNQ